MLWRFFAANHLKTAKTLTERLRRSMNSQEQPPAASTNLVNRWAIKVLSLGCFLSIALPNAQSQDKNGSPEKSLLGTVYRFSFEEDKTLRTVTGELVASDLTMGQLILDSDGQLTVIAPNELKRAEELSTPLVPTPAKDLAAKVLAIMPQGSRSIVTEHFVVCYNTSDVYARWNSDLYERLFKGFYRFWKEKGVELTSPRFPLVAVIFETKDDYIQFASKEFAGAENTIGYFHQSTNRLASYDLTGIEGLIPPKAQVMRAELINQIVSRPQAERLIATIVLFAGLRNSIAVTTRRFAFKSSISM